MYVREKKPSMEQWLTLELYGVYIQILVAITSNTDISSLIY